MTVSVIIPSYHCEETLPRTIASVQAAAKGLPVEIIVSEDPTGKGAAWARNQGLARATGEVIFFVDGDDTVEPDFFAHPLAALASSGADFCIFQYDAAPLKRDYNLTGNAAIRAAFLPALIGFSFADVRRWNRGGDLFANREPGTIWRAAFRRDLIVRHQIRFNESLPLYEDAPFLAECALCAEKVVSLRENLYNYVPGVRGVSATITFSERYYAYKFAIHAYRLALEEKYGGVWDYCAASAAFTALEFLKTRRWDDLRRYLAEPRVREAIHQFPKSWRHPLTLCALLYLTCWYKVKKTFCRVTL